MKVRQCVTYLLALAGLLSIQITCAGAVAQNRWPAEAEGKGRSSMHPQGKWLSFSVVTFVLLLATYIAPMYAAEPSMVPVQRMTDSSFVIKSVSGWRAPQLNLRYGSALFPLDSRVTEFSSILAESAVQPLSLAAGDFDSDGTPDLVGGYVGPDGGILVLYPGNVDAIFPYSPAAQQRTAEGTSTAAPFLFPARTVAVPEAPAFIGTGDFDADGHIDIVMAAAGNSVLYWLFGDGRGELSLTEQTQLPGEVTALAVGEVNRRDGLQDVVVGIIGPEGPQALVLAGPGGARRAEPETLTLPDRATAIAIGQLDEEFPMDFAVAAGQEVVLVYGHDDNRPRAKGQTLRIASDAVQRVAFSAPLTSLAIGDLTGNHTTAIAALSTDGRVYVLERAREQGKEEQTSPPPTEFLYQQYGEQAQKGRGNLGDRSDDPLPSDSGTKTLAEHPAQKSPPVKPTWQPVAEVSLSEQVGGFSVGSPHRLLCARLSGRAAEELIVLGHSQPLLQVLAADISEGKTGTKPGRAPDSWLVQPVGVGRKPVAVLPMRLNGDALSDLVVLEEGASAPAVLLTEASTTFVVDSVDDGGDTNLSDDMCKDSTGKCTLRAAIQQANANPGVDTITFSVGVGVQTITPTDPLPTITDSVTIDGTTQPGFVGTPIIEINGSAAGISRNGLMILAGSSVVRGLVINRFRQDAATKVNGFGIVLDVNGGNTIEGNYIGTDVTGTAALGNEGGGIGLFGTTSGNLIGGTTTAARNVIAGNGGTGMQIASGSGANNLVEGNLIGTDVTGAVALRNGGNGVFLDSPNNTVGGTNGTTPGGARTGVCNVISSNGSPGVFIGSGGTGNIVQGNRIGTDITGTMVDPDGTPGNGDELGNFDGVVVAGASNNLIGGTTVAARNLISGNFFGLKSGKPVRRETELRAITSGPM